MSLKLYTGNSTSVLNQLDNPIASARGSHQDQTGDATTQLPLGIDGAKFFAPLTFLSGLFAQRMALEFIYGSAIHPELFAGTTEFHQDLEVLPGGDVSTPIHDALNWHYTRFGSKPNDPLEAIFLLNEDGSTWQLKLDQPLIGKKGKPRKYETPKGNGSRAFLPTIPPSIRLLISRRYDLEVPETGSFWSWLATHPELPIVITEGGKKALALLSEGYIAIALYGVNGGYSAVGQLRSLITDLLPFMADGRPVTLAFDQDPKLSTRTKVQKALGRFGQLLKAENCCVSVATWSPNQGKGVDDLIVQSGWETWQTAYDQAASLGDWLILRRMEGRLTHAPWIRLNVPDLSQIELEGLPASGFIALVSPKGTGKTKFIADLISGEEPTLGLGHRVCLGRELARRWNLHYRGDLDKVNGNFITGSAYVFRVWSCFDSLLAIDPHRFEGCDLVLDEVVQGVRHLLTSQTCRKGGKLMALLARFRHLVQAARRLIVADADLCDWCIDYLQSLRGDGQPCFLIENTYRSTGYTAYVVEAPNPSPVVAELLKDLERGHRVFVATDSKRESEIIAQHCQSLAIPYLLINSDTSGEETQQAFITNPDYFLQSVQPVQVVITSPSLGTGTSIESQYFTKVYGIFRGTSITHEDVAQALFRVRDLVPRVVWCAEQGRAYSKISNSHFASEVRQDWQERSDAQIAVLTAQVAPEMLQNVRGFDWEGNPEVQSLIEIEANRNWSMAHFRRALRLTLVAEGHQVIVKPMGCDEDVQAMNKAARQEIKATHARAILQARIIDETEAKTLEQQDFLIPGDRLALKRFLLCEFYVLEPEELTLEWIEADLEGLRRGQILELEALLSKPVAVERDSKALEQLYSWNRGLCPWNLPDTVLRREVRLKLGLDRFLVPGYEWTAQDLEDLGQTARQCGRQIKASLNFTISKKVTNTQIAHQLLYQIGIRTDFYWSRSVPGQEGKKVRVYFVEQDSFTEMLAIIKRRQEHHGKSDWDGAPSSIIETIQGIDPSKALNQKAEEEPVQEEKFPAPQEQMYLNTSILEGETGSKNSPNK